MKRHSGILLPISSLASEYGIGDLGPSAYAFIDFCKQSGQTLWQVLPLNPTDGINGHSPYSSASAFAGNPLFISPVLLAEQGLLNKAELKHAHVAASSRIDFDKAVALKEKLLSKAFARFSKNTPPPEYHRFIETNTWVEDYALFLAIKSLQHQQSWNQWPKPLRTRQSRVLNEIVRREKVAIDRIKFIQYVFYKQWIDLKAYANAQGVQIVGDIPIYVNFDSVDVWCNPGLFQIDTQANLKFVSGCPPDYFSKTGQRWGNPTFNWAQLKKTKYQWWIQRIAHNLMLFDYLRIDHFRGFLGFWQIPAHEKLAVFGRWVKAPGADFFNKLKKQFGKLPLIAEDLGEITEDVTRLMRHFNFPGMRVLLFGLGGDPKTNPHVPANFPVNCVAYTGTHDNNTVQGWFYSESKDYERALLPKVLGSKINPSQLHWTMIEVLQKSQASMIMIAMQDILGLRQDARLNTPATKVNNWAWRLTPKQLTLKLAQQLKRLTVKAGRYGIK